MSGQRSWQAPDGRWYPPGQEKPEKKSRLDAFREWISTTAGVVSAIVAVVALLAGGTAVSVKILTQSPKPPVTIVPTPPDPTFSNSPTPSPINLQSALLASGTLGSAAIIQSTGTDLSKLAGICGGHTPGLTATATAYETIQDQQTGTFLHEALVSWPSAIDAGRAITIDRQAVDQSGSCSFTYSGVTAVYKGDDAGSPPSSCTSPGQYFATQVQASSPSIILPYNGYLIEAQCGTIIISVRVYSDQLGAITQQAADGYLSSAIGQLDSTTS